jgi:NADH:ubiquinone oxidoreductase subunit B-like Fe-S oxidoreductase
MGVMNKVPVYVEKLPGGAIITAKLDDVLNYARASSMWYLLSLEL